MDIGDRYVEQERYSDAIKEYDQYLQKYPSVPAAYTNKAYCLVKLGQMIHALPCYEAALRLNAKDPNAHFNVGYVLSQLNRHEEALKAFDGCLKLKESDVGYFNRGNELSYLGRLEEAIAAYETAIKLNPKNKAAELNRDNCIVALKMHVDKYKKKGSIKANSAYPGRN